MFFSKEFLRKFILTSPLLIITGLGVFAVVRNTASLESLKPYASTTVQTKTRGEQLQSELITIRGTGIRPSQLLRARGKFLLIVDNRSGLEKVDLRIDGVAGNRVREATVHRTKLDWQTLLDLHPGDYVLTEASHPDWVCHIKITN